MKFIVSEQKPESSVKDCLRKRKQTSNLLLINSHFTTKFMTENSDANTLFTNLNESNIPQVYFAKTARTVFGIPLFSFSIEL